MNKQSSQVPSSLAAFIENQEAEHLAAAGGRLASALDDIMAVAAICRDALIGRTAFPAFGLRNLPAQTTPIVVEFNNSVVSEFGAPLESEAAVRVAKSAACTRPAAWEIGLSVALCNAYACCALLRHGSFDPRDHERSRVAEFAYVGAPNDAALAAQIHDTTRRRMLRARAHYLAAWVVANPEASLAAKIAAGDSFSRGYAEEVARQLPSPKSLTRATVARARQEAGVSVATLVAPQRGENVKSYRDGQDAARKLELR